MGNIITWLIAIPIIVGGAYILIKSFKKGVKGDGCSGCSGGCGCDVGSKCNH